MDSWIFFGAFIENHFSNFDWVICSFNLSSLSFASFWKTWFSLVWVKVLLVQKWIFHDFDVYNLHIFLNMNLVLHFIHTYSFRLKFYIDFFKMMVSWRDWFLFSNINQYIVESIFLRLCLFLWECSWHRNLEEIDSYFQI